MTNGNVAIARTSMLNKRTFLTALAGAGVTLAASPTFAQSYPDRPIRLIVPFPPGGPMDVMARMVGHELSAALKQPVIAENRAGAGGALGSKAVAIAEPDGYTLLWAPPGRSRSCRRSIPISTTIRRRSCRWR